MHNNRARIVAEFLTNVRHTIYMTALIMAACRNALGAGPTTRRTSHVAPASITWHHDMAIMPSPPAMGMTQL